jgi:hypothetical protein
MSEAKKIGLLDCIILKDFEAIDFCPLRIKAINGKQNLRLF